MPTLRSHRRIPADPEAVWAVVGAPERLAEWFPGVRSCEVEGAERIVELASGVHLVEEIVECDPRVRRLRYRITSGGPISDHEATVDVIDEGNGSLVVYTQRAEPPAMALVIGGACEEALDRLAAVVTTGSPGGGAGT